MAKSIKELYPELSPEEVLEAEQNMRDYAELLAEIFMEQLDDNES